MNDAYTAVLHLAALLRVEPHNRGCPYMLLALLEDGTLSTDMLYYVNSREQLLIIKDDREEPLALLVENGSYKTAGS